MDITELLAFSARQNASDQALRAAESENDVRLAIKLAGQSKITSARSSLEVDTADPHFRDKWWQDKDS